MKFDQPFEDKIPTILVVDDTVDNLDLLEFALKRKPIKMLRASSGRECLQVAKDQVPDVILLDIQMPEMDGFETLRHLRAHPVTTRIPVIFLTAQKKDPQSIERGLELGADEYLTKPIDTEELLVRTRMLVRLKHIEAELERTKADFMAMLVHDLRSPLSGIKGVIDLLKALDKGAPLTEEYFELLTAAQSSAVRMLDLINDLLDLSKYEAGNITLEKEVMPIELIIETVCRQLDLQFKQKNISIVSEYGKDLPPVHVDPVKAGQVVMNLLSNAWKFTKEGGKVVIRTEGYVDGSAALPESKRFIAVVVSDTGVGIASEEIPMLFERYRQVSSAKKSKQKGTGLGLAICKLIVEAHGGMIKAESRVGEGTTFRFTLPVAQS